MTEEEWTVIDTVSVHPSTLLKLSTGELEALEANGAIKRNRPRPRSSVVTHRQMHQELWRIAIEIAQGDRSRIEIHSEMSVTIHNNDKWRN